MSDVDEMMKLMEETFGAYRINFTVSQSVGGHSEVEMSFNAPLSKVHDAVERHKQAVPKKEASVPLDSVPVVRDDNATFANKMVYKRTGQCPVCNKLIRRGQGSEGRGKFEIKHIPPNTPMYNLMLEPEPRAFSGLDEFVESMVEVVPVALERLVARYGDGGSGIEMVFFIGAATKRNGEPIILVGEPSISMHGEPLALTKAHERIEVLEREIANLHEAELARIRR